ncbi:PREDICTED: uncharacterized protein LOC104741388 [Camelina sativa]|uniref:Uncharacterized protein LOC104741388 n=1 Tax=Camelina sativa TaxID=90675 RepID=A0ABM0VSN9_CAMSA|nr:PREDICTED: uncharacterized protein LOC104741388 [Camelina sativa]
MVSGVAHATSLRKSVLIELIFHQTEILLIHEELSHRVSTDGDPLPWDTTSPTESADFLWFSSSAPRLGQNHQSLLSPSSEIYASMTNFTSSPISGRRSVKCPLPVIRKLGFSLVDLSNLGPLKCQKPNMGKSDSSSVLQKPRFNRNFSLLIFPHLLRFALAHPEMSDKTCCKAIELFWLHVNPVRILVLDSPRLCKHDVRRLIWTGIMISPPWRWGYRNPFKPLTLSQLSPELNRLLPCFRRATYFESKSLKKIGIMISSPKRGSYRSFLKTFYPYPLVIDSSLVQFISFRDIGFIPQKLQSIGIMTTAPRSGGYQQLFKQTCSDHRTSNNPFSAAVQTSPSNLMPARRLALETSLTSLSLMIVTMNSSNGLSVDDLSMNRVITCTTLLLSFGTQAPMESFSTYLNYLCVVSPFSFMLLCFVLSFSTYAPMACMNSVMFD